MKAQSTSRTGLFQRIRVRIGRKVHERRFLRYALLTLNVLLLAGVVVFVVQSSPTNSAQGNVAVAENSDTPSDPLDQISSAGIAANVAQMANLSESSGVIEQAYSADTLLSIAPAQTTVIAKPQTVETELKSKKDIKTYVTKDGDTIASVAAQFGVTSESIMWSNSLSGNAVAVGTKLTVPPVIGIVYTVAAGDTPDSLAQKFRANKEQIIAYNDAELGGLRVGEQIIVPNGQLIQTAPSRNSYASSALLGSFSAIYGYNGYDRGFCTWYVANRRAEIGRPLPSNLGNASTWDDRSLAAGLLVNKTPAVGAAVVTSQRGAGHVAFVERVNSDGSIWISEMNSSGFASMDTNSGRAGGWGKRDYKLIPADLARTYNYIH
jgi:surface antigen